MVNNHAGMVTKIAAVWGLALALLFAGVSPLAAQTFSASPQDRSKAYYEFTLEPGATIEDGLMLGNSLDTASAVQVTVARGQTLSTGGIGYPDDASGPAQWIQLGQTGMIELEPQGTFVVPFRVTVPPRHRTW